ncbi:NAD(P)H-hydrate dehydratase [Fulvimarina endophytica]|uniref:Bifunctional NAD(P)H-hydrate repair enzyme n=2 Tax=Fulvimarina endophytica TaxID=2293836 RepID=A0A371XBY3_9HYPH|nr:NAD(P)H-hydrate dehydratase [Fulvimarina endophytica]
MAEADRITIEGGFAGFSLMIEAGRGVADAALAMLKGLAPAVSGDVVCLAGPGKNGGDALVAAEFLRRAGWPVVVRQLGDPLSSGGDVAEAFRFYRGRSEPITSDLPQRVTLFIDGLFGAGLSRPIQGELAEIVEAVNKSSARILAIDLPSGICGRTGAVLGTAVKADRTVTFFRGKPGHLLDPGRSHCGVLDIVQIGIEDTVLQTIRPTCFRNGPALWNDVRRRPQASGHKYDRGHAVVFSGPAARTGAARLSASAALRAGAGLVTMFSPPSALLVNASHLTAIMLKRCEGAEDLFEHLKDDRLNAFVLGPGFGVGKAARQYAELVLGAGRLLVLDADGLTSFADDPNRLFAASRNGDREPRPRLVLTPHMGEFARLFPDLAEDTTLSKLEKTKHASERSGAIVVLKGADTVIASPDGRAAINDTGTPWLATAGTGDVLTGILAAQLAQRTPAFEAACMSVWMHSRAAELFGPGLIAEDLPGQLPTVLTELERLAT